MCATVDQTAGPGRYSLGATLPAAIVDGLVAVFGMWSLFAVANVYTGRSFDALFAASWLPVILAIGILVAAHREAKSDPGVKEFSRPPGTRARGSDALPEATLLLAGAALVAWHYAELPYWVVWTAALIHLASVFFTTGALTAQQSRCVEPYANRRDLLVLALCALGAMILTLAINRPDADDAYYLSAAISSLDHSELALLSFDGMHGDHNVPIQQLVHRPQTYELLIAATAKLTGLPVIDLYYIVFPAFFAAAFVIAQWTLLKRVEPSLAWLALPLVLMILVSWGDGNRTFGNFAFVRLFQGKAIMLCVFIPLIVSNALRFTTKPAFVNWLLLMLAQCAAAMFTSSALVIAPLCMGLGVLAGLVPTRKSLALLGAAAMSAAPLLITLLLVRSEVTQASPLISEGSVFGLASVVGSSARAPIALLAVLALPWLAHRGGLAQSAWLARYVALIFLLVLNGVTAPLLSDLLAALFSWRLYWTLPMGCLVALSFAAGLRLCVEPRNWRERPWTAGLPVLVSIGTVCFAIAGQWTTSPENQSSLEWARPKQSVAERQVAMRVIELASERSVVLAPRPIAAILTGFHDAPSLVGVQFRYLVNLSRYWGVPESRTRIALLRFVAGDLQPQAWPAMMSEIESRGIDLVVSSGDGEIREALVEAFIAEGFESQEVRGYFVWTKGDEHESRAPATH